MGHRRTKPLGLRSLGLAVLLTSSYAVIELIGGFWSGSLALISDAGHMATDASALMIALVAQAIARRAPTVNFSFGYGRVEVLAAFVNGLILLALTLWIVVEALQRFAEPHSVKSEALMVIAAIGLVVNVVVAWSLSRDRQDLNARAALAHVLGDLLGSVAALCAGLALWMGAPNWTDPALSLLISVLILRAAWEVTTRSFQILMERTPEYLSLEAVAQSIQAHSNVTGLHNLHVWELAPGQVALSAHLELEELMLWPDTLHELMVTLHEHGIDHVTLQPERSTAMHSPSASQFV